MSKAKTPWLFLRRTPGYVTQLLCCILFRFGGDVLSPSCFSWPASGFASSPFFFRFVGRVFFRLRLLGRVFGLLISRRLFLSRCLGCLRFRRLFVELFESLLLRLGRGGKDAFQPDPSGAPSDATGISCLVHVRSKLVVGNDYPCHLRTAGGQYFASRETPETNLVRSVIPAPGESSLDLRALLMLEDVQLLVTWQSPSEGNT